MGIICAFVHLTVINYINIEIQYMHLDYHRT
jgi:hypothetical protein